MYLLYTFIFNQNHNKLKQKATEKGKRKRQAKRVVAKQLLKKKRDSSSAGITASLDAGSQQMCVLLDKANKAGRRKGS